MSSARTPSRIFIVLATLVVLGACQQMPEDSVALVDGQPLRKATFDSYLARHDQNQLTDEAKAQLLDQAINMQMLAQDALRQKLDQEPKVAGDLDLQRSMRLANAAMRKHLEDHPVTDEALAAEYAARTARYTEVEYKARHILVPSEAEAKDVIRQLDRGGSFAKLARTKSIDPGSAKDGGDLGWFTAATMVPQFAQAVTQLAKGKHSKQPVATQFGFHVILLEDQRQQTPPPLESVRQQLESSLQEKTAEAYINGLRGAAKIVKRDDKPAVVPAPATAAAPTTSAAPATSAGC
jgi:peptidyl-prolyl cis-trans isomerase C